MAWVSFQSTHPRGVRLKGAINSVVDQLFQSTHPRGVRRQDMANIAETVKFQSTHPRGVRLDGVGGVWQGRPVSIHAPARGATAYLIIVTQQPTVSIHAPARGATLFDPGPIVYAGYVSIHAPARGATRIIVAAYHLVQCFNPRTREGCD